MMNPKESVYLGTWNFDLQMLTIDFNMMKALVLGYEEVEIPRPTTYEFFTEKIYVEDYPSVRDAILSLIRGEMEQYDIEYRIRTKHGGVKWFRETCEIDAYDDNGKPKRAHGETFDITQSKDYEKAEGSQTGVRWLDDLTQVMNREAILGKLREEIKGSMQGSRFLSVGVVTLPGFFEVNAREGRPFGDDLLRRTADIIKSHRDAFFAENHDKIGRYDINTFLLIFSDMPNLMAREILSTICETLEKYDFGLSNEENKRLLGVRFGVAEYLGESAEALVEKAIQNGTDAS